jgi:peptidase E
MDKDSFKLDMDIVEVEVAEDTTVHLVRLFQGDDCVIIGGGNTREEALMTVSSNLTDMLGAVATYDLTSQEVH